MAQGESQAPLGSRIYRLRKGGVGLELILGTMPPVQSKALSQEQLAELWNTPRREDGMTPKQLCLAFGLREAWRAQYGEEKTYGMLEFVKDRLKKRCKLSVSTSALR